VSVTPGRSPPSRCPTLPAVPGPQERLVLTGQAPRHAHPLSVSVNDVLRCPRNGQSPLTCGDREFLLVSVSNGAGRRSDCGAGRLGVRMPSRRADLPMTVEFYDCVSRVAALCVSPRSDGNLWCDHNVYGVRAVNAEERRFVRFQLVTARPSRPRSSAGLSQRTWRPHFGRTVARRRSRPARPPWRAGTDEFRGLAGSLPA